MNKYGFAYYSIGSDVDVVRCQSAINTKR